MRAILQLSTFLALTLALHAPSAGATADEDFAVAANHYSAGRWQVATSEFQSFQQRYPQHPRAAEAEFFQAEALVQLDRLSEATTQYEQFLLQHDHHPLAPQALFRWGECSYRNGNQQVALRLLRQFCNQQPDHELNAYALPHLGRLLAGAEMPADAVRTFHRALDRFPQGPLADECLLQLAILSYRQQHYEEALAKLDQLQNQFPNSGRRNRADYWRARVLLVRREYAEAADLLEPLTEADDTRGSADPQSAPHPASTYLLSLAYVATQRPAEALCVLQRLHVDEVTAEMGAHIAVAEAMALRQLDRSSEAVSLLRAALAGGPSDRTAARCRARLIDCLLAAGQPEAATEVFAGWASSSQRSVEFAAAAGKLAETAYAEGDYRQATELFAILVDSPVADADKARGLSGLAWSHLQLGNAAEAERSFAQLAKRFPQDRRIPEARLAQARLLEDRGQIEQAMMTYARVLEGTEDVRLVSTARLKTALLHEHCGESHAALTQLDLILEDDPTCDQLDQVRYLRGWILQQLDQQEQSTAEFQFVHDRYPHSSSWPDATYRLAERAYQAQEFDRACQLLQELTAAELTEATHRLRPYALYLQGRVDAAQNHWRQTSSIMSRVTTEYPATEPAKEARFWLAESQYQLGEYDAAWAHFQPLVEATAQPTKVWTTIVPLRRAQIMAARNQWPEALAAAQSLIEQQPDFPRRYEADYVVGRALMSLARLDEARIAFQRIVDDPHGSASETAAMAQWMIGETYLHQRQYQQAIQAYLKVDLLYDYDHWRATALLQAAVCYECLQEPMQARRVYQQLIDQFPQFEQQQTAEKRLEALEQTGSRQASATSSTRS